MLGSRFGLPLSVCCAILTFKKQFLLKGSLMTAFWFFLETQFGSSVTCVTMYFSSQCQSFPCQALNHSMHIHLSTRCQAKRFMHSGLPVLRQYLKSRSCACNIEQGLSEIDETGSSWASATYVAWVGRSKDCDGVTIMHCSCTVKLHIPVLLIHAILHLW